jgi:cytochrome d ubiquinol oxidase subunit I
MLWILMLAFPFPYIANTAGWITAEAGRQPWLVYGLLRTEDGYSTNVSPANGLFTLLGYMGIYGMLSLFLLFLFLRHLDHGPSAETPEDHYLPATISGGAA